LVPIVRIEFAEPDDADTEPPQPAAARATVTSSAAAAYPEPGARGTRVRPAGFMKFSLKNRHNETISAHMGRLGGGPGVGGGDCQEMEACTRSVLWSAVVQPGS